MGEPLRTEARFEVPFDGAECAGRDIAGVERDHGLAVAAAPDLV
jgi:hypothetical protein